MKIIYFSQDYTVHDYNFLEKLARTQHEVYHLRFETSPIPLEDRPLPKDIKEVDWMGSRTYREFGWGKWKQFQDFRRVLKRIKPDLVHAGPVQKCGFFTALAGFKPLLLMSWGSDILLEADRSVLQRWITKFTIRRADSIACDCMAVRDKILQLVSYPVNKIVVFPWGVNLNQFHPASPKLKIRDKLGWNNNKVIISTRSLEPIYGIETFLEAAKEVIESNPDVRILMLGGGSLEAKVRVFIAENNLENTIHLAGRIPHDTLPNYLNEANLFVSSSLIDGTSVSLLEAMACRLPVVVTDLNSNREWVKPGINGWLVPPGDAKALGVKLLEILDQVGKAEVMAETNLSLARRKANWDNNFDLLLEVYERLAKGGTG